MPVLNQEILLNPELSHACNIGADQLANLHSLISVFVTHSYSIVTNLAKILAIARFECYPVEKS